jgi:predicted regulator of Ras-like GTPase activity (Roadblock/LC7/MglB family)
VEELLRDLNGVVGVQGACVFDGDGSLLASTLPPGVPSDALRAVGRTFTRTLEALRVARRRKVNDVDLLYESGRLVVKNLTEGCLIIQCTPTINVPLLNLTANVVARKLHERIKDKAPLPSTEAQAVAVAAPPAAPAPVEAVLPPPAAAAPAVRALVPTTPTERTALELVEKAREKKIILRVMGRGAVRLRSPTAAKLPPPAAEEDDLSEIAGRGGQSRQIGELLDAEGFLGDRRFNTLFGRERMRFAHPATRAFVEVFLDALVSYHRLEFGPRLHLDEFTLPLADLLLSQLLNVKATEADLLPICGLFHDADLGGPGQAEVIDATYVVGICSDDWGWYKTVTMNLERCVAAAPNLLAGEGLEAAVRRMKRLQQMIEEAPKTLRWQMRARVGESRRWYEEPD